MHTVQTRNRANPTETSALLNPHQPPRLLEIPRADPREVDPGRKGLPGLVLPVPREMMLTGPVQSAHQNAHLPSSRVVDHQLNVLRRRKIEPERCT